MINRILLQYAAPCARVFWRCGLMSREDYGLYRKELVGKGEFPVEKFRKIFWRPCGRFDPERAKDGEVRKYFLGEHNMEGKEWCNAVEAVVLGLKGEKVLVKRLDNGREIEAHIDIREKLKIKDRVVFHIDGVVDKL